MWDVVRVIKHGPLSQEVFLFAQGVLHGPMHSKAQLSLPNTEIESLVVALNPMKNREQKNGSVGNREAHLDASPDKCVAGQYPHRADYTRYKEGFCPRLLEMQRIDPSPQVRADRHSEEIIFQIHQKIFFKHRTLAGFAVALVGINTFRV